MLNAMRSIVVRWAARAARKKSIHTVTTASRCKIILAEGIKMARGLIDALRHALAYKSSSCAGAIDFRGNLYRLRP
jgi:hypothetical protein